MDQKCFNLAIFVMLGITSPVPAAPFTKAEDQKTAAWILAAYEIGLSVNSDDLEKAKLLIAQRKTLDQSETGFSRLQACRTVAKYKPNPLPLVAAEHYAYMRWEASKTGDTKLRELPRKYEDKKRQLIKEGKEERLQTTDWPVSPPSDGAMSWANLGVEDGLADYKAREKKDPAPGTLADSLESDMNRAASYNFFGWIGRTFGTPYVRTGNGNCLVKEPILN